MSRSYKKNGYRKSRVFDVTCRSHGGCPWCRSNRRHGTLRRAGAKRHRRQKRSWR